jgi:thymidylate synthase
VYIMQEYDEALRHIIKNGVRRSNRTNIDTISVFGYQARYSISEHFPILTKRKMFYKSIFKELLWILSGSTNVNELESMGSKIWSAWRDKGFENSNGYDDGDLGPIYGWQLRHFGGDYKDKKSGFDQLKYVANELKNNKFSRRILFTYWNAPDVTSNRVKLPPCHHTFQLYVDNNDRLSGMLYQRSADYPIGVPANIQFYSALIYMLAQQCGNQFTPHELIHSTGDSHIYLNQVDAVEEYLNREKTNSPKLILNKAKDIFSYSINDFEVINYNPQGKIKIPVEV